MNITIQKPTQHERVSRLVKNYRMWVIKNILKNERVLDEEEKKMDENLKR